jgi:asparagine synthase (glutamine-hydrolysing)
MIAKYISLVKLLLVEPSLGCLAWNLKRDQKTYLGYQQLLSLTESFRLVMTRRGRSLQVAEFGVGRGGSATLLGWLVARYGGNLVLYDVFGRIPPPTVKDGARAQERYEAILCREDRGYYGNVPGLMDVIRGELGAVCSLSRVEFVVGRYEETLSRLDQKRAFDLVHIDCDWYESSRAVLSFLESNVSPGAVIQVDDYSNWPGSRMATDETEWLECFQTKLVGGTLVIDTGSVRLQGRAPRLRL